MSSDRWPVTLLKVEHCASQAFNCGEYGISMDSDVALGDISDIAGFIRGSGEISNLGDSLKDSGV